MIIKTQKRENRRQKEKQKTYRVPKSGERNDTQTQEDQWLTTRTSLKKKPDTYCHFQSKRSNSPCRRERSSIVLAMDLMCYYNNILGKLCPLIWWKQYILKDKPLFSFCIRDLPFRHEYMFDFINLVKYYGFQRLKALKENLLLMFLLKEHLLYKCWNIYLYRCRLVLLWAWS